MVDFDLMAVAAGDKGKLFGSVTSTAVVDYLHSQGMEIERKKVELPDGGIKQVGSHNVKIKLYGGEEAALKVNVNASGDEKAAVVDKKPVAEPEPVSEADIPEEESSEEAVPETEES